MATYTIDTHATIKQLEAAGMDSRQAGVVVAAISRSLAEGRRDSWLTCYDGRVISGAAITSAAITARDDLVSTLDLDRNAYANTVH